MSKALALFEHLMPSEANVLVEEITSPTGKSMYVTGIFMQADIKNRNQRVYPITEIARVVTEAAGTITESGGIPGELDHPQTLQVSLDRISHVITEMRMDGKNAIGKAKLLNTPTGQIARSLIEGGVRIGISSRGAGSVSESGVVDGFQFITADLVAQPSAPSAIMTPVYESLQHLKEGKQIVTLAEAMREDPKAQKFFEIEMRKFIDAMTNRPNKKLT